MLVRDRIAEIATLILERVLGYQVTHQGADWWESSKNFRVRVSWNAALAIWEIITGDTPDLDADIE